MQFNLFMYCTVGRRAELESGMAGKDPRLRVHHPQSAAHRSVHGHHLTGDHTEG